MSDMITGLPTAFREIIVEILIRADPELMTSLQRASEPSIEEREKVEDIISTEFMRNLGPGGEPTERGKLIDTALGAFLLRWPIERGPHRP